MTIQHQLKRIAGLVAVAAVLVIGGREVFYARSVHTSALVVHLSDDQIAKDATLVVQGTVAKRLGSYRGTDGSGELMVYTRWLIHSDRVLKGSKPDIVVVRTEGGRVGLTEVVAEDAAEFSDGESVLLYLQPDAASSDLRVVGMFQGHFSVGRDANGAEIATQQGSAEKRPVKDLESLLR